MAHESSFGRLLVEMTDVYRALASARPDAFTPNLAVSLNSLAIMLNVLGRHEDALAASREAVIKLMPYFMQRPAAYAG